MERVFIMKWDRVSLVIPEKRDLDIMYKWINNIEISKNLAPIRNWYYENEESFYNNISKDWKTLFMIYENETAEIIWSIWFNEYSAHNRNWIIWITLYLEEKLGKWYWTEAMKLFIDYAFNYVWSHKVKLAVFSTNERWIKSYLKSWFREVWRLKEELFIMWKYIDEVIMELTREDYLKNHVN